MGNISSKLQYSCTCIGKLSPNCISGGGWGGGGRHDKLCDAKISEKRLCSHQNNTALIKKNLNRKK